MNITYLIGAGASQQCLPIVSEMSKEINQTIEWFEYETRLAGQFQNDSLNSIIADLKNLKEVCEPKRNFSIDTYAKKLRISGRIPDYDKLKDTLTLFFTLQQKRKYPDVRYDNFWASLLDQKDKLPDNINVLSWNYDFQFERTYQEFIQSNSLRDAANALNILTHKTPKEKYNDPNKFSIFKLNGSATYNTEIVKDQEKYIVNNLKDSSLGEFFERIFDYYSIRHVKNVEIENHLSYAWEHDLTSDFFVQLRNCVFNTKILIVIGYSFPYFNREIDKFILNDMRLSKVYIQDPNAANIKERFLTIKSLPSPERLKTTTDTYQFTLPNEL